MRATSLASMALLAINFPLLLSGFAEREAPPFDSGGVLRGLSIASFPGSNQDSVRAIATDSDGNIFVTGTTFAPNFPVKNAAQSTFGESTILRTTDLGVTWTRTGSAPPGVTFVAPDPVAPQVLFATAPDGIYKSIDSGQTWRMVHSGSPTTLAINPGKDRQVAAVDPQSGGVIRSLDGGETWMPGGATCSDPPCGGQLLADPTGSGTLLSIGFGVWISRDWGLTFQELRPPPIGAPSAAAFDPSHPGWIYVDNAGGVMGSLSLTTDYGATWTARASPPTIFSGILELMVDPNQPSTLLAATPDGLYKSTDGAASWTAQAGSGPGSPFNFNSHIPFIMVSKSCHAGGGLFGVGGSQASFSPDDGETWATPQLTGITEIVAGPNCAVYVARTASSDAFVVKLTPDGGTIWSTFLGGSDADAPAGLAVDALGNVYVAGNTTSPDFPASLPRIGMPGKSSAFLTKFSPAGKMVYSVVIGGEQANSAFAVAADQNQNAWVVGSTNSLGFPVTPGALFTAINPQSYTGYLLKLSSDGSLNYATYLGTANTLAETIVVDEDGDPILAGTGPAPGLPAPAQNTNPPFVMQLDQTGSKVISASYLQAAAGTPIATALDRQGNLVVVGGSPIGANITATPGAYNSPPSLSTCPKFNPIGNGPLSITRLRRADWSPVYLASVTSPCGVQSNAMALDNSGAVVLGLATGPGLDLHHPLIAGPPCSLSSSAIAKLSPDGSTMQFATYLDNCGAPGIAVAGDGSIYAGVSPRQNSGLTGVLRLKPAAVAVISLDHIGNAFSGDGSAVVGGGLYSLTGSGFSPPALDLGLNSTQNLPMQLGGVQVKFDGVPAPILSIGAGRVVVVAPSNLPASTGRGHDFIARIAPALTAVQIFYNGVSSDVVWMPISAFLPGLLTLDFPNLQPRTDIADGNIRNSDGTLNSANNPAPAGSTITVFSTGMGATNPAVDPGSIAQSTAIVPTAIVYSSWQRFSLPMSPVAETTTSVPGFVSALFGIQIQVPVNISSLGPSPVGNGVQRVLLSLKPFSPESVPSISNTIGVYVK